MTARELRITQAELLAEMNHAKGLPFEIAVNIAYGALLRKNGMGFKIKEHAGKLRPMPDPPCEIERDLTTGDIIIRQ